MFAVARAGAFERKLGSGEIERAAHPGHPDERLSVEIAAEQNSPWPAYSGSLDYAVLQGRTA